MRAPPALESSVHHSTIIFRGLKVLVGPSLCRETLLSDNECDCFQSGILSGSNVMFKVQQLLNIEAESSTGFRIMRCCYCNNFSKSVQFIGQILCSDRGLFFNANVTVEYFMKEPSHRLLPGKLDTNHACIYII